MPRTTQHPVHEPRPPLREGGFDSFAQTADECASLTRLLWRQQQHLSFFRHSRGQPSTATAIAAITQHDATVNGFGECPGDIPLVDIGRSQCTAQHLSAMSCDDMQLEAKEPACGGFPVIRPIFSEEAHAPMPNRLADRNRLGIHQIERRLSEVAAARDLHQLPDQRSHRMESLQPLFVGTQK